jgi:processing peptidase subunit beta
VWIEAGSRHETSKNNGVAHLLEHLAFKGTTKRSQQELELEAETSGLQLAVHSSQELTAVYAKCLASNVSKAVELLADIVLRSSLTESDIDSQRKVVISELQEAENNQTTVLMDYLFASAYQGTPLAQSVLGTTNSLQSLKRKDLTEFIGTHYKAPRMVLAAAGGVEHSELVELAEKHFGDASLNSDRELPRPTHCRFTGSELRARYDDLPLAHVAIAIEGAGYNSSRDSLALTVAQKLIGSWDRTYGAGASLSSKLASACAQEEMCHSFQAFYTQFSDTALWGTYFVSDRMTIEDMMYNVQGEWMRLCSSVTEFEVERAKNVLKTSLFQQLSASSTACDYLAKQVLFSGKCTSLAELDAEINSISANTVRDVLMKYVYDKCPVVTGVGPLEQLPDYNRVRGSMFWLRL